MNYIKFDKDKIYLKNAANFNLAQTLDCGQAFRWRQNENGVWSGIVADKCIELYEDNGDIIITGSTENDFKSLWKNYFDLDRDYENIISAVSADK